MGQLPVPCFSRLTLALRTSLIAAIVLAAALPSSAAAFSWEAPTVLSDPFDNYANATNPESAMNAAGVVGTAFTSSKTDLSAYEGSGAVFYGRTPTGTWSAKQFLPDPPPGDFERQWYQPQVAIEPDGDVVALMQGLDNNSGKTALWSARRAASTGSWSAPAQITPPGTVGVVGDNITSWSDLVVDGNGKATVFFVLDPFNGSPDQLYRAESTGGGAWTRTVVHTGTVDTSGKTYTLSTFFPIDTNDSGGAIAVFSGPDPDPDPDSGFFVSTRPDSAGSWSAVTRLDPGMDGGTAVIAAAGVDHNGNARVVMSGGCSGLPCVKEFTKTKTGGWSAAATVPVPAGWEVSYFPVSTVDSVHPISPAGEVLLFLNKRETVSGVDTERFATMSFESGTWSAPVQFYSAAYNDIPNYPAALNGAIAPDGTQHVVYAVTRPSGGGGYFWTGKAVRRAAGGSYGSPQVVMPENTDPFGGPRFMPLMLDGDGNPTLVYSLDNEVYSTRGGEFPKAEVTPTSVDFGGVAIGGPANERTVKLENTGDGTLNVSQAIVNGPFIDPDGEGTGPCVGNLAPGDFCEVDLEFAPTDTSTKNGSLVFTHNAAGSPITVPLTGSGFNAEGEAAVNVAELQFGSIFVGSESAAKTASLTNVGDGPLHISDVTAGAPFTLSSPDQCDNKTLQPTQSCGFNVRFAPSAAGAVSSTIAFATDAPTGGRSISLKGTGIVPALPPPSNSGGSSQGNATAAAIDAATSAGASARSTATGKQLLEGDFEHRVVAKSPTDFTDLFNGIVASGGGIIGQAGSNLTGPAGNKLIGQAGSNLIGQAGSNSLTRAWSSAASSIRVKCPRSALRRVKKAKRKKVKCKQVLLATGTKSFAAPGTGVLTVKPTAAGAKLIRKGIAYAKKQRKKRRRVAPLTMSYATLVRIGGPGSPGYYTVKKLKIKP